MWEILIKLDNNSSERCLIHRLSVHNYYRMRKQEIRWGEEMRTENCKKNKTTELKKFQVTHSEVSWAHSSLPRCYAVNHKELALRSFSNKFHWSIEYETRLMSKRRKKKLFPGKGFKIFKNKSAFCGSSFFRICTCPQPQIDEMPLC